MHMHENRAKDASTTQSKLGFKICGMQVFRCLVCYMRMPAAVYIAAAQLGNVHNQRYCLSGIIYTIEFPFPKGYMPSLECRHLQRGFWRASKRWCKGMSEDAVNKALLRFANNGANSV